MKEEQDLKNVIVQMLKENANVFSPLAGEARVSSYAYLIKIKRNITV